MSILFSEQIVKAICAELSKAEKDWLKALDMPAIGVYRPNHTHIFYLREFVDPDGIDKQYEQRARNRTSNRRLN